MAYEQNVISEIAAQIFFPSAKITQDVIIKTSEKGTTYLRLSLAASRVAGKNANGENEYATTFYETTLYGDEAKFAAAAFQKGDRVQVTASAVIVQEYAKKDGTNGVSNVLKGAKIAYNPLSDYQNSNSRAAGNNQSQQPQQRNNQRPQDEEDFSDEDLFKEEPRSAAQPQGQRPQRPQYTRPNGR
jgi:single-stranded DNA-binding protein